MGDLTILEEKQKPHKPSSRRSPKGNLEQRITSKQSQNQPADPNASADVFARPAAASKSSSGIQKPRVKGKTVSLSRLSESPLSLQSSPRSPSLSPQSPGKTVRVLFPNAQSQPKGSDPAPFESIEISSDESELESGPSTAQTTPNPSSAQRITQTPPEKSRAVRPTAKPRTASAPTPLTGGSGVSSDIKAKSAQNIDGDIEDQIRQPKKPSKRGKELGYVYVVSAEVDGKKLIKIGHTTEASVNTRIKGIMAGKCQNTIRILPPEDTSPEHIQVPLFYEQVEKLAHKELANFRHDFTCLCGKRHEEFFAVEEGIGHMVVERWARLCALQPFDKDCVLTGEWEFHLNRFRERNHGRPSKKQHEKKDEHLSRHQRWESFLASKRLDWYRHRAGVLWHEARPHFWQMWSLVLAAFLVFSTLSLWSSGLFVVTAVGICLEDCTSTCVKELASLVRDMAVHCWRSILGNLAWATSQAQQVERTDHKEGILNIWGELEEEHEEEQEEEKEGGQIEEESEGKHEKEHGEVREKAGTSERATSSA